MNTETTTRKSGRPTVYQLRYAIDYNPDTGAMTWKKDRKNGTKAGKPAGTYNTHGYLVLTYKRIKIKAHHVAWAIIHGEWPSKLIDHKNGDKSDMRMENLRECTKKENNWNTKREGKGRPVGVMQEGNGYRATLTHEGERVDVGIYANQSDAVKAREKADMLLRGQYSFYARG